MEKILILLIPVLIGIGLLRLLLIPMKAVFKLVAYSGCGFSCLWLLNCVSGFTGIFFPINAVTVLLAGIGGIPGMAVLALLAVMGQ